MGHRIGKMCDIFLYFYIHCQYNDEEPHVIYIVQPFTGDEQPGENHVLMRTRIIIQMKTPER